MSNEPDMRESFPGFYKRTKEELSWFREKALFVLDTNMLLNIYRYKEETKTRFFEILEKLREQDRLWIPHQVMYEYLKNRVTVINEQAKVYNDVSTAIKQARKTLEAMEYLKERHSFIDIKAIIDPPLESLRQANSTLSDSRDRSKNTFNKLLKDSTADIYREKFTQLFQGIVGGAYKNAQLDSLYSQAEKRFDLQIPPGWKDKAKIGYSRYGDVIIWFQLLDHAALHKEKPIIFVTDDKKSDWYLSIEEAHLVLGQDINDFLQPRPELIQEMLVEAGMRMHIYDGDTFFTEATEALKLTHEPEIDEDVKRVTEQNTVEDDNYKVLVDDSVVAFLEDISDSQIRRKILREMYRLQNGFGHKIYVPVYIENGKLWILQVMDYRLVYLVKPDKEIVIIYGFKKEIGQTQNQEYDIAQREYERYAQEL